jgi:hypothetical protein
LFDSEQQLLFDVPSPTSKAGYVVAQQHLNTLLEHALVVPSVLAPHS